MLPRLSTRSDSVSPLLYPNMKQRDSINMITMHYPLDAIDIEPIRERERGERKIRKTHRANVIAKKRRSLTFIRLTRMVHVLNIKSRACSSSTAGEEKKPWEESACTGSFEKLEKSNSQSLHKHAREWSHTWIFFRSIDVTFNFPEFHRYVRLGISALWLWEDVAQKSLPRYEGKLTR